MGLSFLASLVVYFRGKNDYPYLKLFPPFLLITLAVELVGSYLSSINKNNIMLYNFFSVVWICFYLFIVSLIISNVRAKRIMHITTIIYSLVAIVNIVFIQKLKTFHTVTYSFGFLLIVIFCIYFFYEMFRMPRSVNLKNNPGFWICSGLLFFCCCGFPLYGFINVWAKIPFMVKNLISIFSILNIFLYSLFTIGFLCLKTQKYSTSQS